MAIKFVRIQLTPKASESMDNLSDPCDKGVNIFSRLRYENKLELESETFYMVDFMARSHDFDFHRFF